MQTEPNFSEMQTVAPLPGENPQSWEEGIVVALPWREAGVDRVNGRLFAAGWIYKIQTGPNGDLVDIWWPEDKLAAR